jgi:hypothetical protein
MCEQTSCNPTSRRDVWRFVGGRRESVRAGFHVGIRATPMMRRRASRCTHSMEETNYPRVCTERRKVRALEHGEHPPVGSHLIVPWLGFTHHGVYVGEGRVVHYGALMYDIIRKPVEEVALDTFAEGRPVFMVEHTGICFDAAEIVRRARSRLGERRYRLFTNNCEHFVEWCLHDLPRSFQAETALAYPRLVGERIEQFLLGMLRRLLTLRPLARVRVRADQQRRPRD